MKNQYKFRTSVCQNCGQEFTKRMAGGKYIRKYCSPSCALIGRGNNRKNGTDVTCEWCGAAFYLPKGRIENYDHYFCCLAHQIEWQGRNKVEYACKMCGKRFRWSASRRKQTRPTYCSAKCRYADPEHHAQLIQMNIAQQKISPSTPERIGYSLLESVGVSFERQYLVADKFCVDAFVPSHNLVVQFDGDYWHAHPDKFPVLDTRQKKRARLDKSQDSYMRKMGYTILRLWESDLKQSPDLVLAKLRAALIR